MNHISITIENLKNVKCLKFDFSVKKNVLAIAGENGSGKSTLMTAIAKFIRQDVFDREFKTQCNGASISYVIDEADNFIWTQNNDKLWIETNNLKMPHIEKSFYESSTNGARFHQLDNRHRKESIYTKENIKKAKKASQFITTNLNYILNGCDNGFFDKLKIFSYYPNKNKKVSCFLQKDNHIITEFDLSTGEYFLLSLVKIISGFYEQTKKQKIFTDTRLLLIDEIDIGLHPLAQKRLIEKLQEWKDEYNLLIIIATHSLQILEQIDSKNIYYIENGEILNPIHHGYITSRLYEHEYYDKIILVEDRLASKFIEKLIKSTLNIANLSYRIIPIGGYLQVLSTQKLNESAKIYGKAKVISILDGDAIDKKNINKYKKFEKDFLPFRNVEYHTVELLKDNQFKSFLKRLVYPKSLKDLENIIKTTDEMKNIYNKIIIECSKITGKELVEIENDVIEFICEQERKKLKKLISHLKKFFDIIP